jgi:hypothetical protein
MFLPIYIALDDLRREIRLLVVEPAQDEATAIECSMKVFSLNEDPKYVALSYVWGSKEVTESIIVNGSSLAVTINLASALRELRSSRALEDSKGVQMLPILLWVDAICINQQDVEERNSQVLMMGDIYRHAVSVLAWLGPEADKSSEAMIALRSIAQEVKTLGKNDDRTGWLEQYPELVAGSADGPTPWESIESLWERDYWKVSTRYCVIHFYQLNSVPNFWLADLDCSGDCPCSRSLPGMWSRDYAMERCPNCS